MRPGLEPVRKISLIALSIFLIDQASKIAVLKLLGYAEQRTIIDGFFKLVHWGNTGAAWSLFYGYNKILAAVSIAALLLLLFWHRHFDSHKAASQIALGLMLGGIMGNLFDRITVGHVIDFLYFYVERRGGSEIGFPAFNAADTAICTGVGLIFILLRSNEGQDQQPT